MIRITFDAIAIGMIPSSTISFSNRLRCISSTAPTENAANVTIIFRPLHASTTPSRTSSIRIRLPSRMAGWPSVWSMNVLLTVAAAFSGWPTFRSSSYGSGIMNTRNAIAGPVRFRSGHPPAARLIAASAKQQRRGIELVEEQAPGDDAHPEDEDEQPAAEDRHRVPAAPAPAFHARAKQVRREDRDEEAVRVLRVVHPLVGEDREHGEVGPRQQPAEDDERPDRRAGGGGTRCGCLNGNRHPCPCADAGRHPGRRRVDSMTRYLRPGE